MRAGWHRQDCQRPRGLNTAAAAALNDRVQANWKAGCLRPYSALLNRRHAVRDYFLPIDRQGITLRAGDWSEHRGWPDSLTLDWTAGLDQSSYAPERPAGSPVRSRQRRASPGSRAVIGFFTHRRCVNWLAAPGLLRASLAVCPPDPARTRSGGRGYQFVVIGFCSASPLRARSALQALS
jgi:hypothetical protein